MADGSQESGFRSRECEHLHVRVIATWRDGRVINRRRQCDDCGARFTTPEYLPGPGTPTNGEKMNCHVKNE